AGAGTGHAVPVRRRSQHLSQSGGSAGKSRRAAGSAVHPVRLRASRPRRGGAIRAGARRRGSRLVNAANQRQLTPVLVVIAVLLGAVLLLLLSGVGRDAQWDAARPSAALPPAGSAAGLPPPLPLQQFALVWQKPLFS